MKPTNDTDSDSDEENEAQMRQFLEAADPTLLTNAMFQTQQQLSLSKEIPLPAVASQQQQQQELPRSERYLDPEQKTSADDLQISEHMQTHIWRKLSAIIQNQIEFCEPQTQQMMGEEEEKAISQVKLVANADCFISNEIRPEKLPQKKATIKRRQLELEQPDRSTLSSIAVSGEFILNGQDMKCWAQRQSRNHKLFAYKACDAQGHKLLAIEPTNEFSALRRKNKWNESKICKKISKQIKIKKQN
ncbi:hypothetical protein ACLKA7_000186 [Drosophila subpalustris]